MEEFYQMYKASRDMVEQFRHKDVCSELRDFVDTQEIICKRYDKSKPECYERWKKERNNEEE